MDTELRDTKQMITIWSEKLIWLFRFPYDYVVWHFRLLIRLYSNLSLSTDGRLFCILFNNRNRLKGLESRIHYNIDTKTYFTKSNEYCLHFLQKERAFLYDYGIINRAHLLAKSYLLQYIDFLPGDLVIDCGANVGELYFYFAEKGVKIDYLGFEPSPREFECLSRNTGKIRAQNIGLWKDDGVLEFYVSSQCADSSLIIPRHYEKRIIVQTKRLDSIIRKPIKLFKLEAEGAEPEVLLGCGDLLNIIEYISADLGFERGVEEKSTLAPVINYLLERDFELLDVTQGRFVALFRNRFTGRLVSK